MKTRKVSPSQTPRSALMIVSEVMPAPRCHDDPTRSMEVVPFRAVPPLSLLGCPRGPDDCAIMRPSRGRPCGLGAGAARAGQNAPAGF